MTQPTVDANKLIDDYFTTQTSGDEFGKNYMKKHELRFRKTIEFINSGQTALEIGATPLFQILLKKIYDYKTVYAFLFSDNILEKNHIKKYSIGESQVFNQTYSINIEAELFPFPDESLDFVMCCEVIEHLDIDPMFMMFELNRTIKQNGKLLITTPNSCSARNLWKIAKGFRPHFFTQYLKDRSPYRHNFEYDIHALISLASGAGFEVSRLETHDVFEEYHAQAHQFIRANALPDAFRGDDIFLLLEKTSSPTVRYPDDLYA